MAELYVDAWALTCSASADRVCRCCTELSPAFSLDCFQGSITHKTGKLAHIIVQGSSSFNGIRREDCECTTIRTLEKGSLVTTTRDYIRSERDFHKKIINITIIIIIYPLTATVVGAPQMISQPVSSILPCSPLPSGTCRTPGLSIP